ncbi:cell envelope biogenesis protein AsmA [Thiomicrorhabdus immobilis]|uniref:Cell envelope biogenesis protein AsmA n=1 Tax=Thiomicrorhabdus immobilis TaxID=2791037 RepID=A0ABM7ME61_9GAMM|nr:AsmA family protein [Thiomicrorhabdus immobilis]BCN93650.1 cell envelope biogenesis protein AsmA [Thiomicrorhabdus immobilis]
MKAFGLILKILLGLITIVVIAIGVVIATVDPNDYRDEITGLVKKETGRDLTVETMSLSFFPHLSIDLESASLSNAPGFSDSPFVSIDKVQVGAAILPLLSQKLEVDTLTLHGLSLNLERNKDGQSNWDDLVKAKDENDHHEDKKDDEEHSNPMDKLAALNFGGIDIQNGKVVWDDQQSQQKVTLENLDFTSGAITFGEFFSIALSADSSVSQPQINSNFAINLEAKLEKDGQYAIRNLHVSNTTSGQGIPVKQATTKIDLPSFALENNTLSLPSLAVDYDIIGGKDFPLDTIKGQLTLSEFTGNLDTQAFKANQIVLNSDVTGETIPNGKATIGLNTSADIDLKAQTAKLPKLTVKVLDLTANGDVHASQITGDALVNANINIAQTNLRALLNQLKITLPEMADKSSLTKFAASFGVVFASKNQALKVNDLKLALDDSSLTGNAAVSQFSTPNIRYDLTLNQIDVNRYLPPKKEQPANTPEPQADADAKIELPVELLRKLTIDGTIKVGKASFDKLKPQNIVMTTKGSKGKLQVNPLKADIFKTQVLVNAGLDVTGKMPKYSVKTNTNNLPIGEVLLAFADSDKLSGTGTMKADITTAGERVSEFKKNLNGTAYVDLKDGAIKGFNLAQSIREAKAKLSGKTLPKTDEIPQTDFSSLVADVTIKNGVVNTNRLSAQAPFMRVNGSGTVDLPKETLDYLVKTKIVASDKGQGSEDFKDLDGLTIPVKLKGALTSPGISLDLESLMSQKAQAEIEKKKDEVVKDVQKNVEDKLKDVFKGFKF